MSSLTLIKEASVMWQDAKEAARGNDIPEMCYHLGGLLIVLPLYYIVCMPLAVLTVLITSPVWVPFWFIFRKP